MEPQLHYDNYCCEREKRRIIFSASDGEHALGGTPGSSANFEIDDGTLAVEHQSVETIFDLHTAKKWYNMNDFALQAFSMVDAVRENTI